MLLDFWGCCVKSLRIMTKVNWFRLDLLGDGGWTALNEYKIMNVMKYACITPFCLLAYVFSLYNYT